MGERTAAGAADGPVASPAMDRRKAPDAANGLREGAEAFIENRFPAFAAADPQETP